MSSMLVASRPRGLVRKAQPTGSDVFISFPLTNLSISYMQATDIYIADKVFPVVPVQVQGGLIWVWNRSDFMRDEARPRADGTESAGGGFNLSTTPYRCDVIAFHKDIGDQTRANAASILDLDRAATNYVTGKQLIRRERSWFGSFFTTGVWGTDVTGVSSGPSTGQVLQWNVSTATPAVDIDLYKAAILGATGFMPNTLVLGYQTFAALRNNADIRDRFKYTSADSIDEAMLARYFGIEQVLVSKAVYESAVEGAATSAVTLIAGKGALLVYAAPSASLMSVSGGYTFSWDGYLGSGYQMTRISKMRVEILKSDRIEGEMAYAQKVVAADLGVYFTTVVA